MKTFPNSTLLFTSQTRLPMTLLGCILEWVKSRTSLIFRSIHFLQSCDNMKVVGKFKDECKGQLVLRFMGLHPKLYSFDYEWEAHVDCKNGEVNKPMDSSVTRIIVLGRGCASVWARLHECVGEFARVRGRGYASVWARLYECVGEVARVCGRGCASVWARLRECVGEVARVCG